MNIKGFFVLFLVASALELPLLAAGAAHNSWGWLDSIGRWINLLILALGLLYFFRQPASEFFHNRKAALQNEMRRAKEALKQAEAKLAEAKERMTQLNSEAERIRQQAREEAEREKERIRAQSEEEAQQILAVARREIQNLGQSVRQDLKEYAAEIAVQMAGDRLRRRMDSESDSRLADQFLADLKNEDRRN